MLSWCCGIVESLVIGAALISTLGITTVHTLTSHSRMTSWSVFTSLIQIKERLDTFNNTSVDVLLTHENSFIFHSISHMVSAVHHSRRKQFNTDRANWTSFRLLPSLSLRSESRKALYAFLSLSAFIPIKTGSLT